MVTSKRFCKDCGKEITDTRTIYSSRCEECQKNYREEYNRQSKEDWREHKAPPRLTNLGTTDFNSHKEQSFDKEVEAIKKEMKKLGLRK